MVPGSYAFFPTIIATSQTFKLATYMHCQIRHKITTNARNIPTFFSFLKSKKEMAQESPEKQGETT